MNGLAQGFIHVVDVMSPVLSKLPLYEEGMAWLLPTITTIVIVFECSVVVVIKRLLLKPCTRVFLGLG